MTEAVDLPSRRVQTLWVLDDAGDMLTSNEPVATWRERAPAVHLEWSASGCRSVFRSDVPETMRAEMSSIIETSRRLEEADAAGLIARLRDVSGGERSSSGPVFIAQQGHESTGDVVRMTPENAALLQGKLADWQEGIEFEQPMFASIVDGRAVSICGTVRRSAVGVEAGVDTLEGYRKLGHGKDVVAAWSTAVLQEAGPTAFYSTSWDNAASIALARSLGFQQVGASLWVDRRLSYRNRLSAL